MQTAEAESQHDPDDFDTAAEVAARKAAKARRKFERAEKQRLCLDMRRAGVRSDVIAERLAVSKATVNRWIKDALDSAVAERADDVLRLELERLDEMQVGHWRSARKGDVKATATVLRIMERRARLLRLEQDSNAGAAEVANLLDKLLETPPPGYTATDSGATALEDRDRTPLSGERGPES